RRSALRRQRRLQQIHRRVLPRDSWSRRRRRQRLEPAMTGQDDPLATLRLDLRKAGYHPLPIEGKKPPMTEWEKKLDTTDAEIRLWSKTWHLALNTGIIAKFTPALDIDILDEEAAEAIEGLAREHFEERGDILVRVGLAPKRLIPLRTDEPF